MNRTSKRALALSTVGAIVAGTIATASVLAGSAETTEKSSRERVEIEVFAPEKGHSVGIAGKGWFVDLEIDFPGDLASTGFTGEQLTGGGVHNDVPPFPGVFGPGKDDRLPGLVVLSSGTTGFSGPGTNLANLFNLTGVTNRSEDETEIWDTWITGAPIFGSGPTVLRVAVVADLDGNGVFDDAPDLVIDANGDGIIDDVDLRAIGLASRIETVPFVINLDPA